MNKEKTEKRNWFSIKNTADIATINIYDDIGGWGVTGEDFVYALKSLASYPMVDIRINSGGGYVSDGLVIYNALRQSKQTIRVFVDGICASSASFLAMGADQILMPKTSFMMIHNASGSVYGDANDMEQMAEFLKQNTDLIAGIYAERTKIDIEEIKELMSAETWFTGEQAVDKGFADELTDVQEITNRLDLSVFNKVPDLAKEKYCVLGEECDEATSIENKEKQEKEESKEEPEQEFTPMCSTERLKMELDLTEKELKLSVD